jgi:hypothetical protein
MRAALITPSFSRGCELCDEPCRSVDRYALAHVMVVARADMGLSALSPAAAAAIRRAAGLS